MVYDLFELCHFRMLLAGIHEFMDPRFRGDDKKDQL